MENLNLFVINSLVISVFTLFAIICFQLCKAIEIPNNRFNKIAFLLGFILNLTLISKIHHVNTDKIIINGNEYQVEIILNEIILSQVSYTKRISIANTELTPSFTIVAKFECNQLETVIECIHRNKIRL